MPGLEKAEQAVATREAARHRHLEMAKTQDFDALSNPGGIAGKRVLLIYPPVRLSAEPLHPPFGLISIAAVLESAGVQVEILDLNLLRLPFARVKEEIARREFDVVGIGGMTTVYYYMKLLGLYLKRTRPGVPLIGGGSACSASPRIVLQRAGYDVACVGEGEPIILELVQQLVRGGDLSEIPGIWYRDRQGRIQENTHRPRMANIEDLPLPAYHLIDMEAYIRNSHLHKHKTGGPVLERIERLGIDPKKARRPVMLFTKRGCPYACNFCYRNFGRRVIQTSIDHTIAHMSFLEREYDTAYFVFGDEIFNIDKGWVHEFCERLIAEDRRYILATTNALRANLIDRELLDVMKRAGFCSVGIGIESFYDPTLKAMKKGQTAEKVYNALRLTREAGMMISSAQLLFGYETDGRESMEANIRALDELGFSGASFSIPCPYPGTELYDIAVQRGLIADEEGWLMELADRDISDRVINLSGMSDAELMGLVQYGTDRVRINGLRKQHPVLGRFIGMLHLAGRKVGIDLLGLTGAVVRRAKAWRRDRDRPQQAGQERPGGEEIREEAFRLLREEAARAAVGQTARQPAAQA